MKIAFGNALLQIYNSLLKQNEMISKGCKLRRAHEKDQLKLQTYMLQPIIEMLSIKLHLSH